MIRIFNSALASVAVTLAAGCASSPTQYLTLVPPASKAAASTVVGAVQPLVTVSVPGQVDQPNLVVRLADGSLLLLETVRWIAPLQEEIRSALVLSLADQLAASPLPTRIHVDIERFDSIPNQYASIEAVWSLTRTPGPRPTLACRSSLRVPVGPGYAELARGHQTAISELAAAIIRQAKKSPPADLACD